MSIRGAAQAVVTLSVVVPLTDPEVAAIVLTPAATPVASPVAVMVATLLAEEDQVAADPRALVLPSEKVPVAVNC